MQFASARFPAPIIRSRAVGDFVMTETRYGAGAMLPTHSHERACLVVVLRGTFDERYESRRRDGEPGIVIVRPEGEHHSDVFGDVGGRCLNVELAPAWLARVRDCSPALTASATLAGGALFGRRLQEELTHADDASPLAIESLVLAILADGVRASARSATAPPAWLHRVRESIHDDPTASITLANLAAEAGVHPVHLAMTFRRFFGRTVASYVRALRIELACRALTTSNAPLADVALNAGFSDQSHFGRIFRRTLGTTPAAFRAAAREH
ncbi:MAG: AraC family transcriptional regulator [Thermoanaerobaculia bacterium]|jgi:AraC family transcriptional regulator|nr:AraC family transcriptional regulator [Thermoanaerobaculia bacterium]